ncbi:MAG TPA: Uma2 family endonuclease [Bryobacteraceae bacterium]
MPTAITEAPYHVAAAEPPRKRWTRAECEVLETTGLLDDQKLELIDGELINKMGKKRPHVNSLTFVFEWLFRTFGGEFINTEAPIDVAPEDNPTNEPQPDIIVLNRPSWEFKKENPQPTDLRLVIEVSDASVGFDLTKKARLYARAGILEYWVVDIAAQRLVVHREPSGGHYGSVVAYADQETVAPMALPTAEFRVADAFR